MEDTDALSPVEPEDNEQDVLPVHPRTGPGLALIALVLPILAGIALWFIDSFIPAAAICGGMVLLTAVLLTVDAYRLGTIDKYGRRRESPILLFIAMILLWILGYIAVYFRRGQFGGPRLGLLSIGAALCFVAIPVTRAILAVREPPSCTNPEVQTLVEQVIRGTPFGRTASFVGNFREISFDREAGRRVGECTMRVGGDEQLVRFEVEWIDRAKREFAVKTLPSKAASVPAYLAGRSIFETSPGQRCLSWSNLSDTRKMSRC